MGGITDYTGGLVLQMSLDVAAAVALQERDDRQVGVFSFNLLDDHKPFRLELSLDSLARPLDELRKDFAAPGRTWAAYLLGTLAVLHDEAMINVRELPRGFNLALYSTVPTGGGVGGSAAIEVATMNALVDHLAVADSAGLRLAALCQKAENQVVGAPCGIMDQVASHLGQKDTLLRMLCQPHEIEEPVRFPDGVKAIGLNTNVKHSVAGGAYGRTRAAAFMGHTLILDEVRRLASEAGKTMLADPTGGYLANLPTDDYRAFFRPKLPEYLNGQAFLDEHPNHGDPATTLDLDVEYMIQAACDHHVLDVQRVRRFAEFLVRAKDDRTRALRSAGHLMYASHKSYTDKAGLGAPEADLLVTLIKQHESAGLYGARITGGGCGGTVAVLMDDTDAARDAVETICNEYEQKFGTKPGRLSGSSPGAAEVGTHVVTLEANATRT